MTTPPSPLPPDVVDELLSAQLDGEFDAAARDHGFTPETARAALDATPQAATRRAALAGAQRVSAADSIELSQIERERMVRAATRVDDHTPARPARHAFGRRIVVAAAAVVVLVAAAGGVALVRRSGNGANDSASATTIFGAVANQAGAVAGAPVDLGAVANSDALHAAVVRSGATTLPGPKPETAVPTGPVQSGASTAARPADPTRCLAQLGAPPGARNLAVIGSAKYRGNRVSVATAEAGGDSLGWAFDAATCRVELFYSAPG